MNFFIFSPKNQQKICSAEFKFVFLFHFFWSMSFSYVFLSILTGLFSCVFIMKSYFYGRNLWMWVSEFLATTVILQVAKKKKKKNKKNIKTKPKDQAYLFCKLPCEDYWKKNDFCLWTLMKNFKFLHSW